MGIERHVLTCRLHQTGVLFILERIFSFIMSMPSLVTDATRKSFGKYFN